MSRNGVYNFVLGGRGIGKTYGAKRRVIRDAIRHGEEFVYVRRFETELAATASFFDDIAHEFPDYEFRVLNRKAEMRLLADGVDGEWTLIGHFYALSKSQQMKSTALPRVTSIIFDEFILDEGFTRYLPEEPKVFNEFYSTVDRWQDKTRVFFLANTISMTNPYFIEYKIHPTRAEWVVLADGFIVAHFPDSAEFSKQVKETRFGKFVSDMSPDYADYSMGGSFQDDVGYLQGGKPATARYVVTLETGDGTVSIWKDGAQFYVQERRPKIENIVTTEITEVRENVKFFNPVSPMRRILKTYFMNGNVYCDGPRSRNAFLQLWKVT